MFIATGKVEALLGQFRENFFMISHKIMFFVLLRIASTLPVTHNVHHIITLLLGSKAETVLVKQPCYIQTKMYRLHIKMTIYGHFSI